MPSVLGMRLGLVVGSGIDDLGLAGNTTPVELTVEGGSGGSVEVVLEDHGPVVVLRRHGTAGASVPAHLVDHHANVRALVEARCDRVLALASVGSLRPDLPVGHVVAPDDFLALAVAPSFHDDTRGHTVPGFDAPWRARVVAAARTALGETLIDGGVYAQTRGPRFETPAEVRTLAAHADVVGMTVAAENILAGEAGLAYAALCHVDNLANGVAGTTLSVDEYRANTEAGRASWLDAISAIVASLVEADDPGGS